MLHGKPVWQVYPTGDGFKVPVSLDVGRSPQKIQSRRIAGSTIPHRRSDGGDVIGGQHWASMLSNSIERGFAHFRA
jgi:hypothetical protein